VDYAALIHPTLGTLGEKIISRGEGRIKKYYLCAPAGENDLKSWSFLKAESAEKSP
jgi:hypothetical protein